MPPGKPLAKVNVDQLKNYRAILPPMLPVLPVPDKNDPKPRNAQQQAELAVDSKPEVNDAPRPAEGVVGLSVSPVRPPSPAAPR